jgi:hypothetical protein
MEGGGRGQEGELDEERRRKLKETDRWTPRVRCVIQIFVSLNQTKNRDCPIPSNKQMIGTVPSLKTGFGPSHPTMSPN